MASLSVDDLGSGRFKIRWRELVAGPDGSPTRGADGRLVRRARSITVESKNARDEAVANIRRALVDEGSYEPPAVSVPQVANLELAAASWVAWKRTRCTPSSTRVYAQHMGRLFASIRSAKGISPTEAVVASVLSRDLLIQVVGALQEEGLSESFVYSCARSALEMWRWVADDPDQWPGLPSPPREAKVVLPRPPMYVAPPAPTLAEADACLRYLPVDAVQTRRIGAFLRFTGLRIHQVIGIRRRDLDLDGRLLTVTTGKSRAEKASQRTVPVARALVDEVRAWVGPLPEDALLFPAWGIVGSERVAAIRPDVFRGAWQEATRWGEAREIVWKPANRKVARPEHAFRSAFQATLRSSGVPEEVIDALVGHHGHSTRDRHYVGHDTLVDRMREAVQDLPPIEWRGPLRLERRGSR
ncbi:MAG: tyrosine-type recombinase/integrase [Myxococcota bacterium]